MDQMPTADVFYRDEKWCVKLGCLYGGSAGPLVGDTVEVPDSNGDCTTRLIAARTWRFYTAEGTIPDLILTFE